MDIKNENDMKQAAEMILKSMEATMAMRDAIIRLYELGISRESFESVMIKYIMTFRERFPTRAEIQEQEANEQAGQNVPDEITNQIPFLKSLETKH